MLVGRVSMNLIITQAAVKMANERSFKACMLTKLRAPPPLRSCSDSVAKAVEALGDMLIKTVNHGEGNSALVIGSPGSGKNLALDLAMHKLKEAADQTYFVIYLNGLIHTDDKIALQEISHTLRARDAEEEPAHLSFAATLNLLLEAIRGGDKSNQSIIFVLDEFDLFTHHHNQTLLYNLFDLSQSKSVPMAVVGLTCRLDVIELLEKRVKSRFSHVQMHLFGAQSFEEYLAAFKLVLSVDKTTDCPTEFAKQWNRHIEKLATDPAVLGVLQELYSRTASYTTLKRLLSMVLSTLHEEKSFLAADDFVAAGSRMTKDSKAAILQGVSILELVLILAMKHLREVHSGEPLNFEMVYDEYKKFAAKSSSIEFFKKPIAMKSFEHLLSMELVAPADTGPGSSRQLKEYRPMVLLLTDEQVLEGLQKYPSCPTEVAYWGSQTGMVR